MDRFKGIFAVGFGGAAGAILRYCVILTAGHTFFPFGTLLINIVGSFLLGMINGYFASKKKSLVFLALGSGFCGGFTTMSTFSQEVVNLLQTSLALAGLYIGATLFFGLVAGFFGLGLFNRRRGESL
ncbi:fluoride efflux transporter FluC [Peribacillus simplex]|uniref:Fluoride-specific ion channel FluC n=1 Tax=Peribacillus simplex TaxID=1478 RepID=A0A9W4L3S3_9BACI|nr:CrcB family protein [Peribacillus simplex]MDR4927414.1 CrcB family protein [Peribacillus simplex]WHX92637.1 CrcB family protein [Peribacillus simplex]CAH0258160.1 Putative fluoride ion transporter CrcB [Peribacillus simplex]